MNNRLRKKSDLPYIFMSIPGICVFTVFFIVPLLFTVRYSFFNWTNFSPDISFTGFNQKCADLCNCNCLFPESDCVAGIGGAKYKIQRTEFFQSNFFLSGSLKHAGSGISVEISLIGQ